MSTFKTFQDIGIWQESKKLTVAIFLEFKDLKEYSFKDQIQRASLSIPNNIAEGFDRQSKKEFVRFLYYARGSASEVKSMLIIMEELNYIDEKKRGNMISQTDKISAGLMNLIKYLEKY